MRKVIGISLAFRDIFEDGGLGSLKKPLDGSVERFEAIIKEVKEEANSLIICTAGYGRENPAEPNEKRRVSLADQLKRYEHDRFWSDALVAAPLCWSTRSEIQFGLGLAQYVNFVKKDDVDVVVVVASHPAHSFRIKMCLNFYAPKAWKVKFVPVEHEFSMLDRMLEVIKIAKDFACIVISRWQLNR